VRGGDLNIGHIVKQTILVTGGPVIVNATATATTTAINTTTANFTASNTSVSSRYGTEVE
jgi:hypothetical protein